MTLSRSPEEIAAELEADAAVLRWTLSPATGQSAVADRMLEAAAMLRASASPPSDRETLAAWMIAHGYTTGHGETVADLLRELATQIAAPAIDRSYEEALTRATPASAPESLKAQIGVLLNRLVLASSSWGYQKAEADAGRPTPNEDRLTDADIEKIEGQILALLASPVSSRAETPKGV